ncbi:hypothetical protein BT63DRAFT_429409 [Microthyrium microscopicum]|uniref:Uncharacterized protein n=1 Tax=Microthyrium microscopicum TaxID=703497 RepID=A0A6A6TXV6_9PEZI|nr:hypothetical protein BT63DRAFT_429409 [Microthyrium microscopicum]
MAFRAQQRIQTTRQPSFPAPAVETQSNASQQRKRTLEDSQEEWVLFSPTAPSVTQTETTSTDRTARTAGLSRLSDFGSLDTGAARSDQVATIDDISDNITEHASDQDEDADLDSLDDGLHAFHEPSDLGSPRARMIKSNETVLPTHDGLGTFGEGSAIQDHLRQFERYGARRKHKRRSSVQRTLDALEEVEEQTVEEDRIRRIEHWRLEQSRALLEEIERETRRMRKMSRASATRSVGPSTINMQTKSETDFSESVHSTIQEAAVKNPAMAEHGPPESESFWKRFTRRVIRDLIGIDEDLLSVILGESLAEEQQDMSDSISSLPERDIIRAVDEEKESRNVAHSWQERLLERLARELGILVHQLSEHPGAFSTYLRTQEIPLYAGLSNTSSLADDTTPDVAPFPAHIRSSLPFPPSVQRDVAANADPSLWGIEEENAPDALGGNGAENLIEQEYWEKDLDVRMVFNFLKSRFYSNATIPESSEPTNTLTSLLATSTQARSSTSHGFNRRPSTTSTAQRAAIIRQHHPLASGSRRREHRPLTPHHAGIARKATRTASSSCASQSTKKSKHSSRNYWDIGGSVGSGPAGGVGVWGEVSI